MRRFLQVISGWLFDESVLDQHAAIPNTLIHLLSPARDVIPGGSGMFGYSPLNPIPVNGPTGAALYLSRLRSAAGKRFYHHRLGSHRGNPNSRHIDVYELVTIDGSQWLLLFFDIYHPRRSRLLPSGLRRKFDKRAYEAFARISHGTNQRLLRFPHDLPLKIERSGVDDSPKLAARIADSVREAIAAFFHSPAEKPYRILRKDGEDGPTWWIEFMQGPNCDTRWPLELAWLGAKGPVSHDRENNEYDKPSFLEIVMTSGIRQGVLRPSRFHIIEGAESLRMRCASATADEVNERIVDLAPDVGAFSQGAFYCACKGAEAAARTIAHKQCEFQTKVYPALDYALELEELDRTDPDVRICMQRFIPDISSWTDLVLADLVEQVDRCEAERNANALIREVCIGFWNLGFSFMYDQITKRVLEAGDSRGT